MNGAVCVRRSGCGGAPGKVEVQFDGVSVHAGVRALPGVGAAKVRTVKPFKFFNAQCMPGKPSLICLLTSLAKHVIYTHTEIRRGTRV